MKSFLRKLVKCSTHWQYFSHHCETCWQLEIPPSVKFDVSSTAICHLHHFHIIFTSLSHHFHIIFTSFSHHCHIIVTSLSHHCETNHNLLATRSISIGKVWCFWEELGEFYLKRGKSFESGFHLLAIDNTYANMEILEV